MRAREPDLAGEVDREGVAVHYEVYGDGPVTVLLVPTSPVVDAHHWKAQVPYLARHHRVVTIDPRGNGASDRPTDPAAYADDCYAGDVLAVMDATGTSSAFLVALCAGVRWSLLVADAAPERVRGLVAISGGLSALAPGTSRIDDPGDPRWAHDYEGWAHHHSRHMVPEAHSTKIYDDLVAWALQTDRATLVARGAAPVRLGEAAEVERLAGRLTCPVLVVQGTDDQCQNPERSRRLAELTGGPLVLLEGAGHLPHARHPVLVNLLLKDFVDRHAPPPPATATWRPARTRARRALWVCSPIGLGHVLRDLTIVRSLRAQVPDLEVEWLAQPPVTQVLRTEGERVHDASADLASESAHWEDQASGHDLHAFHAMRQLDEVFCANYLVFDEVVRATAYDLWVGDEAWEVDHFLHENPERKIAPYAFLTDVVGFLPVDPGADPREAELCADYNAEMVEHRARHPAVRDRSLFVGGFDELPDASLGDGLPGVREWARTWFDAVPYVVPFDPPTYRRTAALRRRLGYGTGYPLYVAAVGGTAVGRALLELVAEAFALLRLEQPDARMVMVTGPRIDPAGLPDVPGLDRLGYVPSLFEHLACADVAVVQGGLSTTMELVAARRPFVYVPLARHWEQQHFVTHRLDHFRAGVRLDHDGATPRDLVAAIATARARGTSYRAVRRGGEHRAAEHLASLVRR